MNKYKLNITELYIILGSGETTLYKYFSNANKLNKSYSIDLDKLILKCKVNNCLFEFEKNNNSFLDRMLVEIDIEDIPDKLKTKDIIKYSNLKASKLYALREKGIIEAETIEDERYKLDSKGRIQYLYNKSSFLKYLYSKNMKLKTFHFVATKQFYSTREALKYLEDYKDTKISLKTLYRYIYEYQKIPAIKIGETLRIPMLELHNINVNETFKKKGK